MSVSANSDNPLIVTDRNNENILAYRFPDLQYSPMGMFILYRLILDRDIKGIVTSSGNTTGTGKTTLATYLCRWINEWTNEIFQNNKEWNAEENSFMDVYEYIDKYERARAGEVLFTDELETMVDKRRSMSHENVDFSHIWMKYRFKNVITWATAPSLHNLDKRIKENTDIWINIVMPGRANVYFLTMHDFIEQMIPKRFKRGGFRQSLLWLPPEQDDTDYKYLKSLKVKEPIHPDNEITKEDIQKEKKSLLDQIILNLLDVTEERNLELTQEDIANDILDGERSQQYISKVKRENT